MQWLGLIWLVWVIRNFMPKPETGFQRFMRKAMEGTDLKDI